MSLNRSGRVEEALIAADDAFEKEFFVTCENASLMYELGEWLIDMERYKVEQKIFQRIIRYYQSEREWLNKAIKKEVNVAISNSFGFGGHNITLVLKKFEE